MSILFNANFKGQVRYFTIKALFVKLGQTLRQNLVLWSIVPDQCTYAPIVEVVGWGRGATTETKNSMCANYNLKCSISSETILKQGF